MATTKVEKIEEINIMDGIDFKSNQKRVKAYMKKQKRKEKFTNVLLIVLMSLALFFVFDVLTNSTKKAKNDCISKGHSANYCELKAGV